MTKWTPPKDQNTRLASSRALNAQLQRLFPDSSNLAEYGGKGFVNVELTDEVAVMLAELLETYFETPDEVKDAK